MDFSFFLFAALFMVLLLGGAILGAIAFFRLDRLAHGAKDQSSELATLRGRIAILERAAEPPASNLMTPTPSTSAPAAVVAPPTPAEPGAPSPSALPQPPPHGLLRRLEELIGGRLSVLFGGLALALGGVFLVRYTIEQGLLGPAGRIALGAVFAAALAAAGEYLRRSEPQRDERTAGISYVPGALTAAAIVTAFATIYAAHVLYGFLGPVSAFVLLGVCGFAALAISAIHGPALAALGLVGSFATPLLIGGATPDAWLLLSYLMIVTSACYFTAHLRQWQWLAIAATVGADLWGLYWLVGHGTELQPWALATYILVLTASALLLLRRDDTESPATASPNLAALGLATVDRPLTGQLAGHALLAVGLGLEDRLHVPSIWALMGMSLMLGSAARSWRSLVMGPAIGAISVVLTFFVARDPSADLMVLLDLTGGPPVGEAPSEYLWIGGFLGVVFAAAGFIAFRDRRSTAVWPVISVATPLLLLIYAYWFAVRVDFAFPSGVAPTTSLATVGALAAIASAFAAEVINRRPRSVLIDWGVGIYAAGAVAFLALGLSMVLEKGWLTVALAAMAPGLALIERQRPIGVLRWLIAGLAALVALRLLTEPTIVGGNPGRLPIVNWLLYAYGLPAAAFWYSARTLRQGSNDLPVKIAEASSIAFFAALIGVEIRHFMTGGDMTRGLATLGEFGLYSLSWLGLAIGLRLRAGGDNADLVQRYASYFFGGLGTVSMLLVNLLLRNPAVTGIPVGEGLFFNDLLLAYGLPALLSGGLYWLARKAEPRWLAWIPGSAALILAFGYLTFEVARLFEGPLISMSEIRDGELYAYSVAWLLFALALLTAGIRYGSAVLRQAAFGVLLLATLKVFLVDLAGLTGLQQAGSFIGLGLALIGIGLAYQRLVLRAPAAVAPPG